MAAVVLMACQQRSCCLGYHTSSHCADGAGALAPGNMPNAGTPPQARRAIICHDKMCAAQRVRSARMTSLFEFPNTGKTIRLGRILHPGARRAAVVAFDHGLHIGVIPGVERPGEMLEQLAEAGADAFLVSPGIARRFSSVFTGRGAPGLILRVDWTNRWREPGMLGSDEGRGRMIASVEGALQLGADAMLTYMFFGYGDPDAEARQAEDVARLAETCEAFGMGCIIEPMARGVRADHDIYRAEYVALGARIACELGADILKTDYTGSAESFRTVTAAAFRPILIAGGPKTA